MRQPRRSAFLIAFSLIALLSCGCQQSVLPSPGQDGWPGEASGRQLYNTAHAYIYASSRRAAVEADEIVRGAAAAMADLGGLPGKGLVIVTDVGDTAPGGSARRFHSALDPADDRYDCPGGLDRRILGMTGYEAALCRAEALTPEAARELLGAPITASAHWAVAIPTGAMIDRGLPRSWAMSIDDQPTFTWKAIALAILPVDGALMLPLHREVERLTREETIFEQMAAGQIQWDPATRQARVIDYRNRLAQARTRYLPVTWFPPM